MIRKKYETGQPPTKCSSTIKNPNNKNQLGWSNGSPTSKVIQIINISKSSSAFKQVTHSPVLGEIVTKLASWGKYGGCRFAQDQVWAKPPGGNALTFHRDSPYFCFDRDEVVTVWLALDDMDEELGPLEYVIGSHRWENSKTGSASVFFDKDHKALMLAAWKQEQEQEVDSRIGGVEIASAVGLRTGCVAVHNGKCWHGSDANRSGSGGKGKGKGKSEPRSRRGLGIHFVPADVSWDVEKAERSSLWREKVVGGNSVVSDNEMPIIFRERGESREVSFEFWRGLARVK